MKPLFAYCLLLFLALAATTQAQSLRDRQSWDDHWRFHLGDIPEAREGIFNDSTWRQLALPHDWSIEGRTDPNAPTAGGGGFFPTGIAWYRRTFVAPTVWIGKCVFVEFEGIAGNAEVTLNGQILATHPNAFTSFVVDLTPQLKYGRDNVLAVRVDNSQQPNTRYYTGSGLYRHVWLNVTGSVHIAPRGVFVATKELTADSARLEMQVTVKNNSDTPVAITLQTQLFSPDGRQVPFSTETPSPCSEIPGGSEKCITYDVTLKNPQPWSPDTPALYHADTRVLVQSRTVDQVATSFGVRTIKVSAERGFELNGQLLKLRGGNVHSDHGPLGAASFDCAEERKVQLLKAAGFNAVRTAHNPPSPAFLDACDRLGLFVVEEAFDCWEKGKVAHDYSTVFKDWWQRDVDAMVQRDRNHPSVIMWSIGNELYERGNANGLRIATELAARIRTLDSTRPLTAGINGLGKTGDWSKLDPLFATLNVAGYNYELPRHIDDHARLPSRVILSAESYQTETFQIWNTVLSQPYIIGDFVWSALDYLGEAGIGRVFPPDQPATAHWIGNHYPWHGAACGDIDLTGLRKPASFYREIIWGVGSTKLYIAVFTPSPDGKPWNLSQWAMPPVESHWTWPGQEGKTLQVEIYSRFESVRLYLNGQLLGEKPTDLATQYKASFLVPYTPGKLTAVGLNHGKEVERFTLQTASDTLHLRLATDHDKIKANTQDLSFVVVEALDKNNYRHPGADQSVRYTITGPATIAAIGNADLATTEPYNANPRRLFQGRALVILRSTATPGTVTLTASAPGLKPASISFESITTP